ncbi:MAG: hypothetical protein JW894_13780 [Bacteroidales bacterium]|nr:hypothetical protein [Bacteroidales bacterium]
MKNLKSELLPIFIALILFVILSAIYMAPALQGKDLQQTDVIQFKGMSKELIDYREETGKEALWTNSVFGGMPAYLISTKYKSNFLRVFHKIFTLNNWRPICYIFLYLLGFYLALLAFGVNRWLSIVGAIAYAFSTYFFNIIEAGHISKVMALGYMPPIIAGVHLGFRGRYLWGATMLGLFLSLQLLVVHLQITYYTFLIILVYGIFEFIDVVRKSNYRKFLTAIAVMIPAALLAVGSNFGNILTTYEYGKYSTRSESELTLYEENKTTGLEKDYILDWSLGIAETFVLMIPNFQGGASYSKLSEKSKTYEFLKQIQGAANAKKTIKVMPTYWGPQRFTSPVYAGAIVIFLFVLGLLIVRGQLKWWLLTISILSLTLAWGKNFPWLSDLFIDYLPGYDKFRAVTMTLIIAEFSFPLLGMLALQRVFTQDTSQNELLKSVMQAFYITGGICLFFILFAPALFTFESAMDERYLAQGATEFVNALKADRLAMLRKDTFRSVLFIALAAGVLYFYLKNNIKLSHAVFTLGVLILIDMWTVNKRVLNNDDFVTKRAAKNAITESTADKFILSDPNLNYRVLNLSVSPFQDATTSYFHKSIGGYHGAKMRRYQEIYDFSVLNEMQQIIGALQKGSIASADSALKRANTLNMLNTKYIIYNPEAAPLTNEYALGSAWFVSSIIWAKNADEEIKDIITFIPENEVIIDERFKTMVGDFNPEQDSVASIELKSYAPNKLLYSTTSSKKQLAVFSEIYYPKGWNVYIDDNKSEHFRSNYILRAMIIPAGDHEVEFRFEPRSYYLGNNIAKASSGILLLLILGTLLLEIKKSSKDKE